MLKMMNEVGKYFNAAGLEPNIDKSATNVESLVEKAMLLDSLGGHRYLGLLENKYSNVMKTNVMKSIYAEVENMIVNLTKTKLNSANFFKAINEHATCI